MYARFAILLPVVAVFAACGEPAIQVQIPFEVTFGGETIACDGQSDVQLSDLRFYVSDVRLNDAAGDSHPIELEVDGNWQQSNLALLDLEDGSGYCSNGTAETNTVLRGTITDGDYQSLQFTLGVPFDDNHRDPLLAEAPLDDAAMHWHWRGGYKFLRGGIRNASDSFWVHLGSTGCEGTLQNITGCSAANRVSVQLDNFVPGRDVVVLDLAKLAGNAELSDKTATDCSSGPAEVSCRKAFAALGLDHASGDVSGAQTVFSSSATP